MSNRTKWLESATDKAPGDGKLDTTLSAVAGKVTDLNSLMLQLNVAGDKLLLNFTTNLGNIFRVCSNIFLVVRYPIMPNSSNCPTW